VASGLSQLLVELKSTDEALLTYQRRFKSSSEGAAMVSEVLSAWRRKASAEDVDQIGPLNTTGI